MPFKINGYCKSQLLVKFVFDIILCNIHFANFKINCTSNRYLNLGIFTIYLTR